MRNWIRTLHLSVALVAAIFVVTLGVTGSIMTFETELDHVIHSNLWHVNPQGFPLPLKDLGAKVAEKYPGQRIQRFDLSDAPDLAYRVLLPTNRLLYVNQYTGEPIGFPTPGLDALAYIHQLHLRLAWMSKPDLGKAIVSWMNVGMLFLVISGFYLWWPLKRVTISWHLSPRRRWLDVHAVTGITVFAFLLMIGITGAIIGFDDVTGKMLYRVTGSQPAERPKHEVVRGANPAIGPDRAMEIAAAALPGVKPFMISVPNPTGTYGVRARFPEDLTPGGRSRIEIDQYTGEVIFAEGSRTAPGGTRAVILNRAIHTGDIFGLPSKILFSLASALTVVMAISGLLTWWHRPRGKG